MRALQVHSEARKEAENKVLDLEANLQMQKTSLDQKHEQQIWKERETFVKEINELKLKVEQGTNKETRRIKEIMRQEFEFQANQRNAQLIEHIKSLE